MGMNEIIIIGAGYAGVMAANRLAPRARVTVVAERDRFVKRVRLHELIAGSREAVDRPLREMLDPRVRLVVDRATRVAPGRVELAPGHIVLAVGSGARGGATDWEGALALRRQIARLAAGERVLVRGGGLTGIELAAEIAEARPDLRVGIAAASGRVARSLPRHRDAIEDSLARLGVDLAPRADTALELDATGFSVPSLAADSGLAVNGDGRALVDDALRVFGAPGIWAAGDCAAFAERRGLAARAARAQRPLRVARGRAGPMYRLQNREDRLLALREGARVCRTGGFVHAAAIPRFLAFAVAALDRELLDTSAEAWLALLRDGVPPSTVRFPAGHFHTPEELQEEMTLAGLVDVRVVGLEGPAALALEITPDLETEDYTAAARLAATFESSRIIRNFSCHILGTGEVS